MPLVTHSLKVKCPTWDHVESFYARKVKEGNSLSARVPFHPHIGEVVTIALELPDELVIAIESEVLEAAPAPDGRKSAVRLRLVGLTPSVRGRLESLVAEARRQKSVSGPRPRPETPPMPQVLPPPEPVDAPVDEVVEPPVVPTADQVPERERSVFVALEGELKRMREAAANDVLGVKWDASVEEIRGAYFALTRRLHPDVYARHRSPAIHFMASELFIHINRAYDRMRDAAVASGSAIAPGPALLPHRGWMAEFDDIGAQASGAPARPATAPPIPPPSVAAARRPAAAPPPPPARPSPPARPTPPVDPVPLTHEGLFGDETPRPHAPSSAPVEAAAAPEVPAPQQVAEARALIAQGDHGRARELLVAVLRREPRNRTARSLYHLCSAEIMAAAGKAVEATTQLEVAAAHDPTCEEVRAALARMRQDPARKGGLFRRLFK
ncbi:MAG TPA: tetratricopeptide repeat protein [Kofleriaceae bacterium]|nr:tetratricopeptide repeat protein [Kofleriaceae bacterium]